MSDILKKNVRNFVVEKNSINFAGQKILSWKKFENEEINDNSRMAAIKIPSV